MTHASNSALSVQYDLRPAKQVERRMMLDAFQRLAQATFPIRDYRYTGFGSLFFVDFLIFHKMLGINDMLSIEHDPTLELRVKYNSPFRFIEVKIAEATDVIPTLSPDKLHILWLDYDWPVTGAILNDIYLAGSQLSRGSILLITVDVEPPDKESEEPRASKNYFEREAGRYLSLVEIGDYAKSNLNKISKMVIMNALKEGMVARRNLDYYPLFYFDYADGHRMMTLGGVIGSQVEKGKLNSINKEGAEYLRMGINDNPYEIKVPVFTRKERHMLDSAMPCPDGWQPNDFPVPPEYIQAYREIYRFLPSYAELLV